MAFDRVTDQPDHLFRGFRDGQGGGIDFLEGMGQTWVMQGDDGLSEGACIAGIEGGVPLFIFFAEPDDDDIRTPDQGPGSERVDLSPLVVLPKITRLLAENGDAAIVASG